MKQKRDLKKPIKSKKEFFRTPSSSGSRLIPHHHHTHQPSFMALLLRKATGVPILLMNKNIRKLSKSVNIFKIMRVCKAVCFIVSISPQCE
jgi:hypothetical protein